jgi:4-hydroxythreonine-4-phosphate dehydrogenase
MMKKVAISVGDPNGIGIEILLRSHANIAKYCHPIYCISHELLQQAAKLLKLDVDTTIKTAHVEGEVTIKPGTVQADSGLYSFNSFTTAIKMAESKEVDAIVTLPVNKESWSLAGLNYKGHTDYLREHFNKEAIMMLGCEDLFVALYSEHIPLCDVVNALEKDKLVRFLTNLYQATHFESIGVLGLNPHAGDGGVLGHEEEIITQAIHEANTNLNRDVFHGPLVPDTAFTPLSLQACNRIVAIYHDQGLAPLKALYFDQSINVSLHLPITRTSVDHGTAFDIAYKNRSPKTISYLNAIDAAIGIFSKNLSE